MSGNRNSVAFLSKTNTNACKKKKKKKPVTQSIYNIQIYSKQKVF